MQTVTVAAHSGAVRGGLQSPGRAPLTGALSMLVFPALQRQSGYMQCVASSVESLGCLCRPALPAAWQGLSATSL